MYILSKQIPGCASHMICLVIFMVEGKRKNCHKEEMIIPSEESSTRIFSPQVMSQTMKKELDHPTLSSSPAGVEAGVSSRVQFWGLRIANCSTVMRILNFWKWHHRTLADPKTNTSRSNQPGRSQGEIHLSLRDGELPFVLSSATCHNLST